VAGGALVLLLHWARPRVARLRRALAARRSARVGRQRGAARCAFAGLPRERRAGSLSRPRTLVAHRVGQGPVGVGGRHRRCGAGFWRRWTRTAPVRCRHRGLLPKYGRSVRLTHSCSRLNKA